MLVNAAGLQRAIEVLGSTMDYLITFFLFVGFLLLSILRVGFRVWMVGWMGF